MYTDDILNATTAPLPWERLNGKNILVTGATGLIGSAIIDILMKREEIGCHVFALGRNEARAQRLFADYMCCENFHFIRHDVSEQLEGNTQFHFIIHAASGANPRVYSVDPVGVMMANIRGVDSLLSYGARHGIEKFVFVSSGDVYGEGDGRTFTEDYSGYVNPLVLRSCYPSSKRAAESLCIAYASQHGVDVSIARPSHTYGPHFTETDTRVYAQFIRNVVNDEDIVMKSQGEQYRSWCYVVDCALGILFVLLKGATGEAYNIADERSNITIRQLAEMIAEMGGKRVVIDAPDETERKGFNTVSRSCFDTSRLSALGWRPTAQMERNIYNTITECRNKKEPKSRRD